MRAAVADLGFRYVTAALSISCSSYFRMIFKNGMYGKSVSGKNRNINAGGRT